MSIQPQRSGSLSYPRLEAPAAKPRRAMPSAPIATAKQLGKRSRESLMVLVAVFTYAIGPFDAAPWWEAYSGDLTAIGGLCLLVAAVRRPARVHGSAPEAATLA